MRSFFFSLLLVLLESSLTSSQAYEESISEMLVQCNQYQSEMFSENRTGNQCEKENFSEKLSYVITELETEYSKRNFWCFLFLKNNAEKTKFKLWFSHKNYLVDAYGVKNNKPNGDKWESRILFPVTSFVVVAKPNFLLPDIFGMELNGVDKCPLCGKRFEPSKSAALVSGSQLQAKWPWHAIVYQVSRRILFKCSGTLIKQNAVIIPANCVTENGKKISENNLQVALNRNLKMTDDGTQSNVFRTIVHQDFDKDTLENDIALLMLELQIKFSTSILPICLPLQGVVLDTTGMTLGFPNDDRPLVDDTVSIRGSRECLETSPDFYERFLNDGNLCGTKNTLNFCGVDGFYVKVDGLWVLSAVGSSENSNQRCSSESVLTDVTKYLTWIDISISSL